MGKLHLLLSYFWRVPCESPQYLLMFAFFLWPMKLKLMFSPAVSDLFNTSAFLLLPPPQPRFPTCSLMNHEWLTNLFQVAHKWPINSLLLPWQAQWSPMQSLMFPSNCEAKARLFYTFSFYHENKPSLEFMPHNIINEAYQSNLDNKKEYQVHHTNQKSLFLYYVWTENEF